MTLDRVLNSRIVVRAASILAAVSFPVIALAAPEAAHGAAGEAAHSAAASHGGGGSVMDFALIQFISAIVVFVVVFLVLRAAAWPKILGGLQDREKKIREEIFAAEEARKKAQVAQQEYAREIAAARAEAQQMIEANRAEQLRTAADIRAKAEVELNQMRETAMSGIEAAKRAAINEIYAEAATLATSVAGKILRRELTPGDERKLVEESVAEFGKQYA